MSPLFPACSPPDWVSPLPAQGRGLAGDDALLCTRLLFLRTRPMPSLRCRVTPVQDRLEGLESPCLSPLLGDLREAGTAGMFLPAPASADKQSQRCCWPVGCHLGRWHQSRKDGGPALCGDRDEHGAPARRDADAALPPLTPLKTSRCQHVPPPASQPGGCRIKPLILLPFNPPCAAAAPTSSRSPPYLIKVSAAAPQECRPGYCIPRSTHQPLHPAPAPLTRPRSPSQVLARRKTSRAASPAAKPPREEPERRRRVGGGRRWCHAWPGRHGQIPPE